MAEIAPATERKQIVGNRISQYEAWIDSLLSQVRNGSITEGKASQLIARAMTAKDSQMDRMNRRADTDPKTRLKNAKAMERELEKLVREGIPAGIIIADIDFFKGVNDTYGHQAGDAALFQVGLNLTTELRQDEERGSADEVFRFGGEEFVVIARGISDPDPLFSIAERLRQRVETAGVTIPTTGEHIPLTITLGGGIFKPGGQPADVLKQADQNLYKGKHLGRNQSIVT